MTINPIRALQERRQRKAWLKRRQQERPGEQLVAEAGMFLEQPEPPTTHLGEVVMHPEPTIAVERPCQSS